MIKLELAERILVKGVDDEVLENDLCQMISQFKYNNPGKPIERVRGILKNVMSSADDERDFKVSEDVNCIRLEVINENL